MVYSFCPAVRQDFFYYDVNAAKNILVKAKEIIAKQAGISKKRD